MQNIVKTGRKIFGILLSFYDVKRACHEPCAVFLIRLFQQSPCGENINVPLLQVRLMEVRLLAQNKFYKWLMGHTHTGI